MTPLLLVLAGLVMVGLTFESVGNLETGKSHPTGGVIVVGLFTLLAGCLFVSAVIAIGSLG